MSNKLKMFILKLKQVQYKELITVVPSDLKVQLDQMQMKNNLYRLKLLGIMSVIYNTLNWLIYIFHADEKSWVLWRIMFFTDTCLIFITTSFFLLTGYFSKKGKYTIVWFICYLFIILHFLLAAYIMFFVKSFQVLQIFLTCTFAYIFIPDFNPKIFISFLVLWYFALVGIFVHRNNLLVLGNPQLFAINISLIALIIRILHYNYHVKTFINTFRINALNVKLETLSMTDELTKLNNRRSFLEYMNTVWALCRRLQTPVNILLLDVDYFKKYNDSMGHLEGDKALIAVAQCMKSQIKREADFVARFGGEEFVCLIPFLEKDDALNLAKKLVQKIESMKIHHPMSEISKYVTVSIGMASAIPDDHNSQTQLLDEADKALYMAKQSGRNKVVAGAGKGEDSNA
jgi:diguanylate cyclase (GGDEF)-like protein